MGITISKCSRCEKFFAYPSTFINDQVCQTDGPLTTPHLKECKHQFVRHIEDPFDDKGNPMQVALVLKTYCYKCNKTAEELGYKIAKRRDK